MLSDLDSMSARLCQLLSFLSVFFMSGFVLVRVERMLIDTFLTNLITMVTPKQYFWIVGNLLNSLLFSSSWPLLVCMELDPRLTAITDGLPRALVH